LRGSYRAHCQGRAAAKRLCQATCLCPSKRRAATFASAELLAVQVRYSRSKIRGDDGFGNVRVNPRGVERLNFNFDNFRATFELAPNATTRPLTA
jgi:hypothetical protein